MDLCSRKIVGWSLGFSLKSTLVAQALQQALAGRRPPHGLVHHSDRGTQYGAKTFHALLQACHITPSMSGRGNCYDNAAMESFWSTLKTELLHRQTYHGLPICAWPSSITSKPSTIANASTAPSTTNLRWTSNTS